MPSGLPFLSSSYLVYRMDKISFPCGIDLGLKITFLTRLTSLPYNLVLLLYFRGRSITLLLILISVFFSQITYKQARENNFQIFSFFYFDICVIYI